MREREGSISKRNGEGSVTKREREVLLLGGRERD